MPPHLPLLPDPTRLPAHPPEHYNFAVDVVDVFASTTDDLAMLHVAPDGGSPRYLRFSHFSRTSHRAAVLLANLGARHGDRMIILLPRVPAWWEIATAAIRMGVAVCPTTTLAGRFGRASVVH